MAKFHLIIAAILIIYTSCEEVIDVDLNSSDPEIVVEAIIVNGSVCLARLTQTSSYFTHEESGIIDNASIKISDGISIEELDYAGNGIYTGNIIIGTEERIYKIEIKHNGVTYEGISYMPRKTDIISVWYNKDESQSILNPHGDKVFTINCQFNDNPDVDNFYMIRYIEDGEMLEKNYFMLTEHNNIGGTLTNDRNTVSFSESIFYEGGEVEVQLFSIDESVYNFFKQLNDVLFWKNRVIPPTPYNPASNIDNGALGFFAAWAYDSEKIVLQ
jgi:hypothetical protein